MIQDYGWSRELQNAFAPHAAQGLIPGRVVVQQRGLYILATDEGELAAGISGRLAHEAERGGYPAAGDWVAVAARPAEHAGTIQQVLPRRTAFVRRAAGPKLDEQVVAANVDVAFLTASMNADLNARRLERYLAVAWQSGARPVVVLTKADLCDDPAAVVAEMEAVAFGAPVLAVSAVTGQGLDAVRAELSVGETAVMVGSSGVGKSTLVNALAGVALMATQGIREDDAHGRHTTTHRELVRLPGGALLLDTPGMRELGLWDAESGVSTTFEDIEVLAGACRFHDCRHETEPGCAVRAALEDGSLDAERWRSYGKLQREMAHLRRQDDPVEREVHRRHWVQVNKANKARAKHRGREW